jgi:integrase-like protein
MCKNYIRPAGEKLGIGKIGWHTFRHTYRTLLDETGAPMKVQQELMRHANIQTTMNVYGSAMLESKRTANSKMVRMVLVPPIKRENGKGRVPLRSLLFPRRSGQLIVTSCVRSEFDTHFDEGTDQWQKYDLSQMCRASVGNGESVRPLR